MDTKSQASPQSFGKRVDLKTKPVPEFPGRNVKKLRPSAEAVVEMASKTRSTLNTATPHLARVGGEYESSAVFRRVRPN